MKTRASVARATMHRERSSRAVWFATLVACFGATTSPGCTPSEGDPCEPDPGAPPAAGRFCGEGSVWTACDEILLCLGPAGCGDEVAFEYRWVRNNLGTSFPQVCGCDGRTCPSRWYAWDAPQVRWHDYGACDCSDAHYVWARWALDGVSGDDRLADRYSPRSECTHCVDAMLSAAGVCLGSDGSPRSPDCCDCQYETTTTGEVACFRRSTGDREDDACCDGQ